LYAASAGVLRMEKGGLEKVVKIASSEISVGFKKGTSYDDAIKMIEDKGYVVTKRYDPKRWNEHDIFRSFTVKVKKGYEMNAC
jgi:hypothetical protein